MERDFEYRTLNPEEKEKFQRLLDEIDSTENIRDYLHLLTLSMSLADMVGDRGITMETYRDGIQMFRRITEAMKRRTLELLYQPPEE